MNFSLRRLNQTRPWLAAWIGLALLALALRGAPAPVESGSPFFEVRGALSGVDALPLKSTEVDAALVGPIAEVRVRQTYTNDGTVPLEARYIFPGSTRAAVHAMTMTVGERRIEAQIQRKDDARKTFEAAKAQGRTASLLEAQRSNVFEMNVANILPGDVVTVELRYTEIITPTEGEYEWVFPTVVGPRYRGSGAADTSDVGAVPTSRSDDESGTVASRGGGTPPTSAAGSAYEPVFTLAAEIAAGVPVQSVSCATHPVETTRESGRARVTLPVNEAAQMNRDFILRYRFAGDALAGGLMIDEWRGEKFFLLTLQPPARVTPAIVPPRDYVFVVDVSGSMHGAPLDVAKKLMSELLMTLGAQDSFNVLLFSGGSRALAEEPVAATPENIAAALGLIARERGGGGTELLPALRHALALPKRIGAARSIVVVTDGYVTVEAETHALVRANLGAANLFAFGIGSSVNRELIERLARAGRAEAAVIENGDRAALQAEKFRAMIESPVLTQVRTEMHGFATHDVSPASWPDVFAQRPLVVVGKFTGPAAGALSIKGFTGSGPWEGRVELANAVDLGGRGVLAQLWARERLEELRDRRAFGDDPPARKEEIVQLGLKYSLLTPFTSFVAVDTAVRAPANTGARAVDVPAALPAGMDGAGEVPTTPEPATVSLIVVVATIVAWRVWRERRRKRAAP